MSIDVIVVNYRSSADVAECLRSLGHWDLGTIWVVDNSELGAEATALRKIAADHGATETIVAARNLGFGGGCNEAYRRSQAAFVLLLNPDARIARPDVELLVEALAGPGRLGAVSPMTFWNTARTFVLPAPTPQGPLTSLAPLWQSRSARLTVGAAYRHLALERTHVLRGGLRLVRSLAGAVTMLRRDAVDAAGGLFDPRFFMFFEDADLSLRLRRAGWRLALVQAAAAVHGYRHKASKAPLMERSCHAYFEKNHPFFYRTSGQLRRLAILAGKGCAQRWFERPATALVRAADFDTSFGEGVLAFSPTPWLWPAIFRPPWTAPRAFDADEWELLEPGGYAACIGRGTELDDSRWVWFEKAATPSSG